MQINKSAGKLMEVDLPPKEVLMEKLKKARLLGRSEITDRFYERYVELVAGTRKNSGGLVLVWEEVKSEAHEGRHPALHSILIDVSFGLVISAIADPFMADEVLSVRERMMR
jgi:hypothetical protein